MSGAGDPLCLDSTYDLELYRSLRAEGAAYNGKLQSLWLQKLTLCGSVAAFMVINFAGVATHLAQPVAAGLALAVILALVIDCKVLEYGLHVRAVSGFIVREFAEDRRAARWDAVLWGAEAAPERPLILARSAMTVLSAALPTIALIAVTTWYLAEKWERGASMLIGGTLLAGYLLVVCVAGLAVFRRWRA